MKLLKISLMTWIAGAALAGCSNAKEYSIEGEVKANTAVDGKIAMEFFQVETVDGKANRESVHKVTLDKIGAFKEKVDLTPGSKALVRAIADKDGNGACTEGELWGEATLEKLEEGKPNLITVTLAAQACPKAEAK
jgi:microcompartment protein CcmK/EutM